jgi:signal transduction histidine kinase
MRTIRGSFVLWMTLSSAFTGAAIALLALFFMSQGMQRNALERVEFVGAGIEPLATEVILTPGDVDLELALMRRLTKLREHPGIQHVGIVDSSGKRVPSSDKAEVPAVHGLGRVLTIQGDVAVGAYPLEVQNKQVGYLAITIDYPRSVLWLRVGGMALATVIIMLLGVAAAWLVAGPATRELTRIADTIERLASGETWIPHTVRQGYDEVGKVGAALHMLATRLDRAAELRAHRHREPSTSPDLVLPSAPQPVSLKSWLQDLDAPADIQLERRLSVPSDLSMSLDPALLRGALHALLTNVMTHGGGRATLTAHTTEDNTLVIMVEDMGPGISEWAIQHLFQPTPHPTRGFGVGLALARRSVQSMGGTLDLDPRYRQGARLIIRLAAS